MLTIVAHPSSSALGRRTSRQNGSAPATEQRSVSATASHSSPSRQTGKVTSPGRTPTLPNRQTRMCAPQRAQFCAAVRCENFLYGFQGGPSGRMRRRVGALAYALATAAPTPGGWREKGPQSTRKIPGPPWDLTREPSDDPHRANGGRPEAARSRASVRAIAPYQIPPLFPCGSYRAAPIQTDLLTHKFHGLAQAGKAGKMTLKRQQSRRHHPRYCQRLLDSKRIEPPSVRWVGIDGSD
jgi:hypothetical protein